MNTIIPINRKRITLPLVISFPLIIVLVFNFIYTKTDNMLMNGLFNWILNGLILIFWLPYTVIALADNLKIWFDKKAALIITDDNLDDNLSMTSCGKISWNDISSTEIVMLLKTRILVIKLLDNNKYLNRQNFIQRFLLRKSIKRWNSPVIVSEKRITYDLLKLKEIIEHNLK